MDRILLMLYVSVFPRCVKSEKHVFCSVIWRNISLNKDSCLYLTCHSLSRFSVHLASISRTASYVRRSSMRRRQQSKVVTIVEKWRSCELTDCKLHCMGSRDPHFSIVINILQKLYKACVLCKCINKWCLNGL